MTAGVLEQTPIPAVAEQISHARAMEVIEGAGMVVPGSIDEIAAIVPFAESFHTGSAADSSWVSQDPTTGNYHEVFAPLYEGFLRTARTLGDISFWRLDPEDTGMRGILSDPALSHLHEYAAQRSELASAIRERDEAERFAALRDHLAIRETLYGVDSEGQRGFSPPDDVENLDMSILVAPYRAPEEIIIPDVKRSKIGTFLSVLFRRDTSKR